MKRFLKKIKKALRHFLGNVRAGSVIDIAIFVCLIALGVALVVSFVMLLLPNDGKELPTSMPTSTAIDETFDVEENQIDVGEFTGIILPESEDGGTAYINDTLFIGDSNTARMLMYGPVTAANSLGASSMGIQHVTTTPCVFFEGYAQPVLVADAVKLMQPRRVVLNFGTNNTNWDADTFTAYYEKAIKAIQGAYKETDIVISAVHPVAKQRTYPTITMQRISEFNQALAEMAKKMDLRFLNSTEALSDAKTGFAKEGMMVEDGIHLSEKGMAAYLKYVSSHVYDTEDTRPARTAIPKHVPTPDDFFGPVAAPSSSKGSSSEKVLTISPASLELSVGGGAGTLTPSLEGEAEWKSADTGIATVSGGKVTPVAKGKTTITCTINGVSATASVTVKAEAKALTLSPGTLTLTVGASGMLTPSIAGDATWKSSKEAVATVSGGKVTAVAVGTTTISCTVGKETAAVNVTVKAVALTLSPGSLALTVGASGTLTPSVAGDANWDSSNTAVATVSGGKVTAVAVGTTTITCVVGKEKATVGVTVTAVPSTSASTSSAPPVVTFSLTPGSLTLTVGGSGALTPSIAGAATWASSNPAVATVTNGTVYAVAAGSTTILCTIGGNTASATVTVTAAVLPPPSSSSSTPSEHAHSYTWATTPATCGAAGVDTGTCACGDVQVRPGPPATGAHTMVKDPETNIETCTVCGITITPA